LTSLSLEFWIGVSMVAARSPPWSIPRTAARSAAKGVLRL
jgi:hypothetical protein